MLNLKEFTAQKTFIAPIKDNRFMYNRKKYFIQSDDGWYTITVSGNSVIGVSPYMPEPCMFKNKIYGYSYNNLMVFNNFDVAKRKYGFEVSKDMNFNNAPTLSSVWSVVWEDNNIYYCGINYSDMLIYDIKSALDSNSTLDSIKCITPEHKTVFLFHLIERENIRKLIELKNKEESEKNKREEFKRSTPGRMQDILSSVGASLLNYSVSGKRITIDWELNSTGRKYNTVVNSDDFRVIEAGYCLSGDDKNHSLRSVVILADDYEKRGATYITRTSSFNEDDDYDDYDD